MDIHLLIQFIILIILLALSFFFSSAETALTTVSRIRMRTMAEAGDKRAGTVLEVIDDSPRMLSAILIGNNIVNISASSLATILAVRLLGSYGAGVATGLLTFLVLIFGEITPKSLASIEPERLSLMYAPSIRLLMRILTPVIRFINAIALAFLHVLGMHEEASRDQFTTQELRTIVDVGHESGAIEDDEKALIHNVFDFSDTAVREVMIPRIDMTIANVNWSYDKLMSTFAEKVFTRIPVFEEDADNIVGILNMKDLLLIDTSQPFILRKHLREAYFTYELKKTSDLFDEMRQRSISMAIVLDEFGAVAGLVTLEDLLEELVGEIRDEYDSYETDDLIQSGEREYEVSGSANLDNLMEELPLGFASEDYDTIGGYLTGLFDHIPKVGETYVTEEGVLLQITSVKRKRVEKVRIRLPEETRDEED